jgi:hypothetical protein
MGVLPTTAPCPSASAGKGIAELFAVDFILASEKVTDHPARVNLQQQGLSLHQFQGLLDGIWNCRHRFASL